MLIRIRYNDNRYDMVRPDLLDRLLSQGVVAEFERRDGWVAGGSAVVRAPSGASYTEPERRAVSQHRPSFVGVKSG